MNYVKSFPFTDQSSTHPERRLSIVAKDSGGFVIVEEYFYRNEDEDGSVIAQGWASLPGNSIFADPELAEREIRAMLQGVHRGG
jgi:hypothetical protein